jgi:hypothetical protein
MVGCRLWPAAHSLSGIEQDVQDERMGIWEETAMDPFEHVSGGSSFAGGVRGAGTHGGADLDDSADGNECADGNA